MGVFAAATYKTRRDKLRSSVGSGLLLFMGNDESPMNYTDNCYHFRQDSNFLYFFGIDQPGLAGVVDLDNGVDVLFGNELSVEDIVWAGPQPTLVDQAADVGVEQVQPYRSLEDYLAQAISSGRAVHFLPPYRGANKIRLSQWLNLDVNQLEGKASLELIRAVVGQRAFKSDEEIAEMTRAVNISRKLHLMAMEMSRTGVTESRICGVLHEIVIGEGGQFAYPPIVTINGQTLHNHYYGNALSNGRLLLVDAGAETSSHYAGDITRTFPVDGKFSELQREVYEIVLETENKAIAACCPGITYSEVHHQAMINITGGLKDLGLMKGDPDEIVTAGAHALFCPHGLGHMIGLDVHDMEDLGEDLVGYSNDIHRSKLFGTRSLRLGRTLEPGFTLTVEPGVYFIPELIDLWKADGKFDQYVNYKALDYYREMGGIRIEDNIVITGEGSEVIGKPIPKTVEDIEY